MPGTPPYRIFRFNTDNENPGARLPFPADFLLVLRQPEGCNLGLRIGSPAADRIPFRYLSAFRWCQVWGETWMAWDAVPGGIIEVMAAQGCDGMQAFLTNNQQESVQGARSDDNAEPWWMLLRDDSGNEAGIVQPAIGMAGGYGLRGVSHPVLSNRSTFDPEEGNVEIAVAAAAARTSTLFGGAQVNRNARGVVIILTITTVGTGTLTPFVRMFDPVTGLDRNVGFPGIAAASGIGQYGFACYPGAVLPGTGWTGVVSLPLARQWGVLVTHSDASSWTYAVGACLVR